VWSMGVGNPRLVAGTLAAIGVASTILTEILYGKLKDYFKSTTWPTLIRLGVPLFAIVLMIVGIVILVVTRPR
jgi:hypothetical protein